MVAQLAAAPNRILVLAVPHALSAIACLASDSAA